VALFARATNLMCGDDIPISSTARSKSDGELPSLTIFRTDKGSPNRCCSCAHSSVLVDQLTSEHVQSAPSQLSCLRSRICNDLAVPCCIDAWANNCNAAIASSHSNRRSFIASRSESPLTRSHEQLLQLPHAQTRRNKLMSISESHR
jgi:hypothetical protein